jgi:EAL domain-containing protein (putative c-di-GMP-specific phosphodiesterase class I)
MSLGLEASPLKQSSGRVLIVDDDPAVLRTIQRMWAPEWETIPATDGLAGIDAFLSQDFDVLITDISMPGLDGLAFSERVREVSDDVPVILITGSPSVESAMEAVQLRAFRYLTKPFRADALRTTVRSAAQQGRMARIRREALEIAGRASSEALRRNAQLERALDTLWFAYQPIVDREQSVFGYEALLRHERGEFEDPVALLAAAEDLNRREELCRSVRDLAPVPFDGRPEVLLFVNVDPRQLTSMRAAGKDDPLSRMAHRVVLELTEHIPLSGIADAQAAVGDLKADGFRLAVDDLGAGYSGLSSFAQIGPEFVKLDRGLVDNVAKDESKQRVVRGISRLCHDLGIKVIGEGVEEPEDFAMLLELDCDLFQGYLFGKPGPLGLD